MTSATNESASSLSQYRIENTKNAESLEAAFTFFNETSKQLAQSYEMLEGKVHQLTQELDQSEKEKETEHQEKERIATRMQALLDFLPGGVIVLDAKGVIVEANPAAGKLLHIDLIGKLWRKVILDCFAPKNDDGFEVSTKSGRRISISTESLDKQGQIILLTDQTETRRLQENLSRYEKLSAMGKMVSALAHQIRTPLSAAMLYAGHLCNESIDESKKNQFSNKLYGRLQHMEKQVRDMMLFVKSELPLNDEITLEDLEYGLTEAAEVALSTSMSHINWDNQAEAVKIKCHREALISALMNLINNAIQARGECAEIEIQFKKMADKHVDIIVADKGPGMDEQQLKSAKDMFFTTKPQGTGLGIAVVTSVVKAHGGKFFLDSAINVGTRATITLPVKEQI